MHPRFAPRVNQFSLLFLLASAHLLLDSIATLIQPLWPELERDLTLSAGQMLAAYVLWTLTTNVAQIGFAYWGDRHPAQWLIFAGPLVTLLALATLGWATSLGSLSLRLLLGGLGVAAFHPEAAMLAGACLPENRSRAMSIFAVGGAIGQAAGPWYSGLVTVHWGVRALAWTIPWGVLCIACVASFVRCAGPKLATRPTVTRHAPSVSRSPRYLDVGLMCLVGTLRVLPVAGIPLALAYALDARHAAPDQIGGVQALFLANMGLGGIFCAAWVHRGRERLVLWLLPLLAAPAVLSCGWAEAWTLNLAVAVAGLLLGTAMPVLISYAQQLLPHAPRLASSLTMGLTWGLGGGLVAATMSVSNSHGRPQAAFVVFAFASVVSSLVCFTLPRLGPTNEPTATHAETTN